MATNVVCILTLCRSSPLEACSREIFRQNAGAGRPQSCICRGHSFVRGFGSEVGLETTVKVRRRKTCARERSVVLHVIPGPVQILPKISEPMKVFNKKRFDDEKATMVEPFQECQPLATVIPVEAFENASWIQTQKCSLGVGDVDLLREGLVDENLEDFMASSSWIQETEKRFTIARRRGHPLQNRLVAEDLENIVALRDRIQGQQSSTPSTEINHPQTEYLGEDVGNSVAAVSFIPQTKKCSPLASETDHSLHKGLVGGSLGSSWPNRGDLSGKKPNRSAIVISHTSSQKCGASTSLASSRWGSHLSGGLLRVVRMKSLVSPILNNNLCTFRRIWTQRTVLAAAASAAAEQSASECNIVEDEEYSFTSIAAGSPTESSAGSTSSRRSLQASRRHPVTAAPQFAGPHRDSSSRSRDRVSKKRFSNPEGEEDNEEDGFDVGGQINGRQPQDQSDKDLLEVDKGGNQSQALWIKKAQTVVPRKQSKIDPSLLLSMQSTAGVDAVMQLLEKTTTSKGVANVMGKFASKLTIQDLKQLLTELGTGPQRNWAKALQVFDWMHDMAVYDIDGAMYHSMLVLLGKSKKMDIAESMIERMKMDGLEPDNYIYTALVGGYVRSGNIQKGIALIDQMKADGLRPPVPAYNVLIDGCVKVPRGLELARSLIKQMQQDGITPDRVTYTTMIIVYSRKGYHGEAIRMFQEMQQQDCHPDVLTYNAVLNAYSKLGDVPGMLQVHRSMGEQQVDPDTVTFNILLNALGRAGRTKDVCRFYRFMCKIGVTPDVTTCSILVNAYGKSRAWDELDLLIAQMESLGLQPDLAVYNSLISIYGKAARFEQVEQIVKSLQLSNGIMFDLITYNTLIDVYGKAGRLGDVIKWFSQMRRHEVKPDVRTFNALVHAYGRACQYEGVKEVLNLFRADGSKPDLVFYHTLLFMFAKGAKYSDAWGVIEDMQQEGYTLTVDIYNSLVLVFGRSNAYEAVKLYSHMIASNVQPNPSTFKVLIEVHARKGMVDECLKIYRMSKEFLGEELNDSLLSSVLGACCNMRRMGEAEAILLTLENQPSLPSVPCFNWLILGYGRQGMWGEAEQVLVRMNAMGILPNGQSYSFLLETYSLCGLYGKAEKLRVKMEEHGYMTTVSAYNASLRYHVRSGRVDLALQLLEDLQNNGVKGNHNTYTALISGYGGSDVSVNEKILAHVKDSDKLQLEPKHGIYTALLAAIPKCKTEREAYNLLGTLQRLDCPSEICSILKGAVSDNGQEEVSWMKLAKKFHYIDMNGFNLETQRNLQNALIDALWWLGWEIRALRVVRIGLDLGVFGQVFKWGEAEWTLNLSGGSVGAVQVLLLMWITCLHKLMKDGEKIPPQIRIILAEEWQLLLGDNKAAIEAVEAHLNDLGAIYSRTKDKTALEMSRSELSSWLRKKQLDEQLFLVDAVSET